MMNRELFPLARFSSLAAVVMLASCFGTGHLLAQYGGAPVPEEYREGWDTISTAQASEWLHILAGPTFQGRGSGQPGYTRAAHWVAGKVAEFGLEPMGDSGTYFQMLPMTRLSVDESESEILAPGDVKVLAGKEWGLDRFSDVGEAAGKLAVVSLTGRRPETGPEIDSLRDKVVLVVCDEQAAPLARLLIARRGPAAVMLVVDEDCKSSTQIQRGDRGARTGGLSGTIRRDAAEKIVVAAGGNADWLKVAADVPCKINGEGEQVTFRFRTRQEPAAIPNVVAWLEGSDPAVRDEYIVIGSHLDHLGIQGGEMFPGADDNGSGSTAVLSIARAMASNPLKPKRSVLFIWFAAEEIGLVGSAHYVANPRLPLEKMNCMFNIDMVGRNEEKDGDKPEDNNDTIHLVGSKKGDPGLHDLIMKANECVNFEFEYDEEGVFGRSDQFNFFKKGTSVAFLFGGFHPDYHRPGDVPEKINYDKVVAAARLYYLAIQYASENGPFPVPEKAESSDSSR